MYQTDLENVGKKYPNLFSPLQVGSLTLKNRISVAPFYYTRQAYDHGFSDEYIAILEKMAFGGAGLITVGENVASHRSGNTHANALTFTDPKNFRRMNLIADRIHRHGAAISVEINHGGIFALPEFNNGRPAFAVSECDTTGWTRTISPKYEIMNEDMMNEVADDYASAVANLRDAGFDMVMIHAGNGWLFTQFLSPRTNNRTDEYGGSIENRCRFPMMVLERIRERVGKGFPLDMRLTADELTPGGITVTDAVEMAKIFQKHVNMIQIASGSIQVKSSIDISSTIYEERGRNIPWASEVKKHVDIPISLVGTAFESVQQMEDLIKNSQTDMVSMARQLIADPMLPKKALLGKSDDIVPCIRCLTCVSSLGRRVEKALRCSVNPLAGFEHECKLENWDEPPKAAEPKNILVVGGGPGGMVAALTAARRGHKVILAEKDNELGGALRFSDYVEFKKDLRIYKNHLIAQVNKTKNINVLFNTIVTSKMIQELNPDKVIVAVGASHNVPPIKGMENSHVILGQDVYGNENTLGQKVIVLGGGMQGCETAIHLSMLGKQVCIVEAGSIIAPVDPSAVDSASDGKGRFIGVIADIDRNVILQQIKKHDIEVHTSAPCVEITTEGVICKKDEETILIPADSVVVSLGMKANTADAYVIVGDSMKEYNVIGDCRKVGKVKHAVSNGYFAGLNV